MTIEQLFANAENSAHLAEEAADEPSRRRYQRMYLSWLSLIESEAWLEGKVPPATLAGGDPIKLLLQAQAEGPSNLVLNEWTELGSPKRQATSRGRRSASLLATGG